MKIGIYKDYLRLFFHSSDVEKIIDKANPKADTFVSVSGDWLTGYQIEGHSSRKDGYRKLSVRGDAGTGKNGYSHYVDLNKFVIKCPWGHIGSSEVPVTVNGERKIRLNTAQIQKPTAESLDKMKQALVRPTKPTQILPEKVIENAAPKAAKPITEIKMAEPITKPEIKKAVESTESHTIARERVATKVSTHKKPLPKLPLGWVDLSSMEQVPQMGIGLKAALQLLTDELEKYNDNSLTPLEIDVVDNRIVFKPRGLLVA
jgi:hypothetical protein